METGESKPIPSMIEANRSQRSELQITVTKDDNDTRSLEAGMCIMFGFFIFKMSWPHNFVISICLIRQYCRI